MEFELRPYVRSDGSSPYQAWRNGLNVQSRAKVTVYLDRLQAGNTTHAKWFEGIGELKIDYGPGYRVYLLRDGLRLLILLAGGNKSTQQADVRFAKKLATEYKKEN